MPLRLALPCDGFDARTYVRLLPSGSLPARAIDCAASPLPATDCAVAAGVSLTAVTVTDTVAAEEVYAPSHILTVNVNLYDQL